jgi:hypothetical protein
MSETDDAKKGQDGKDGDFVRAWVRGGLGRVAGLDPASIRGFDVNG